MNVLLINTTQPNIDVILLCDGKVFKAKNVDCHLNHSVVLFDAVDEVIKQADITLMDVDTMAVCIGPGSFTGIRVGISAVKGYNAVSKCKLIAVNSLQLAAYTVSTPMTYVVIPANRGSYVGHFCNREECEPSRYITDALPQEAQTNAVIYDQKLDITNAFIELVKDKISKNDYVEKLSPIYLQLSQAEKQRQDSIDNV